MNKRRSQNDPGLELPDNDFTITIMIRNKLLRKDRYKRWPEEGFQEIGESL